MADVYGGKVFGIFEPLAVERTRERLTVVGGTFEIAISRKTGQVISAKALGQEFVAKGTAFPKPYIGLFPEDEPGATPLGAADRPRFGHEMGIAIAPKLWEPGKLTAAVRHDVKQADSVRVISEDAGRVVIRAVGRYIGTPVTWTVEYDVDVDGFTKVTVTSSTSKPVLLRWHCFNHAVIAEDAADFIVPWTDTAMADVLRWRYLDTVPLGHHKIDELVFGARTNPFFHLGNARTGIEFSKQDFGDRWAGFKDTGALLEDGTFVEIDSVETKNGKRMPAADARGPRRFLTQIYRRANGYEVEEFDVRNTTIPLNPGDPRAKTFWFQLSPPKHEREDINCMRAVWPGPHQMEMVRWCGRKKEWEPPSDEQVEIWAQMGVNLIIGGANYFSGDYSHTTHREKIRHFVDTAHKYGIRVIPYVTFSDFNFCAPGYQEHALDWMCDKGIEFRTETTLMCFNALGWREFFERQVDALMSAFPFDGIYIDHWESTRPCTNERHGCGGYYATYVTEGYHDIARRARKVVARHTGGSGIMMFNSGQGLFSGVLSMFDLRLMGENYDPAKAPELTLESTYNDKRQGLQILAYPNYTDYERFLNFVMSLTLPHRLGQTPRDIREWSDEETGKSWNAYKPYWEAMRFFGVGKAARLSAFETRDVAEVSTPGGRVNAFVKDARALFVVGIVPAQEYDLASEEFAKMAAAMEKAIAGTGIAEGVAKEVVWHLTPFMKPKAMRAAEKRPAANRKVKDALRVYDFETLGLTKRRKYIVQDLINHRVIEVSDIREIPLTLETMKPQVIYVAPAVDGPIIAHFTGADGAAVERSTGKLAAAMAAPEGSPVALYVKADGAKVRAETEGFETKKMAGGLIRVAGRLPEDRRVEVTLT